MSADGRLAPPAYRHLLRIVQWVLTPLLIGALLAYVGPADILTALARIHPAWALASALVLVVILALSALSLWIVLGAVATVRPVAYVTAYLIGWAVNLVSPVQLGDASQLLVLKRHGVPLSLSSAAYALDKAISLGVLALVGTYGLSRFVAEAPRGILVGALLALAIVFLLGLRVLAHVSGRGGRIGAFAGSFREGVLRFRDHRLRVLADLGLTVVRVGVVGVYYSMTLRAFGVTLPFSAATTLPIMSALVGYLPITLGGIGTVEASAVYLFGLEGVPQAAVVSMYLMVRVQQYVLAALLVALSTRFRDVERAAP